MDGINFKDVLWCFFLVLGIFSLHFYGEKYVHFDIWNKKISKISKGPPKNWLIFQIISQIQI